MNQHGNLIETPEIIRVFSRQKSVWSFEGNSGEKTFLFPKGSDRHTRINLAKDFAAAANIKTVGYGRFFGVSFDRESYHSSFGDKSIFKYFGQVSFDPKIFEAVEEKLGVLPKAIFAIPEDYLYPNHPAPCHIGIILPVEGLGAFYDRVFKFIPGPPDGPYWKKETLFPDRVINQRLDQHFNLIINVLNTSNDFGMVKKPIFNENARAHLPEKTAMVTICPILFDRLFSIPNNQSLQQQLLDFFQSKPETERSLSLA
ncbi:MAG: hypothetical protein J0L77_04880 [Alphaproteobacteria bacterium]|nr:hypothetical protein [Alphaproteobacteria bacterium]